MSEDNAQEVVDEEVVVESESVAEKQAPVVDETEAKALKMGWTPRDQFKGDPSKWRPADEFLERGENMLPIVKAKVKQQEREIAELRQAMTQFGEYHNKTEQRAYERAYADLREQRARAIAAGDGAAFDKVDGQIEALRAEVAKKQQPVQKQNNENDPVYIEWKSRNSWIETPQLEKAAIEAAEFLRFKGETSKGNEFLDKVKSRVKAEYPEKFENPRRASAVSVESGSPAVKPGGKSYADMPADARAACDRMAKNAYLDKPKEMAEFKAQYVKNYYEGA